MRAHVLHSTQVATVSNFAHPEKRTPLDSEKTMMESTLLHLKEKGPTVQDKAVLYADVSKILTQAAKILSDSLNPQQTRNIAHSWLAQASTFAMGQSVGARSGPEFVGNPNDICLPPNTSNKRRRQSAEARVGSRQGSVAAARYNP